MGTREAASAPPAAARGVRRAARCASAARRGPEGCCRSPLRSGAISTSWKTVAKPAAWKAAGSRPENGLPSSRIAARVRLHDAGQQLHQRALAGAVLAEDRVDGPGAEARSRPPTERPSRRSAWRRCGLSGIGEVPELANGLLTEGWRPSYPSVLMDISCKGEIGSFSHAALSAKPTIGETKAAGQSPPCGGEERSAKRTKAKIWLFRRRTPERKRRADGSTEGVRRDARHLKASCKYEAGLKPGRLHFGDQATFTSRRRRAPAIRN